MTWRAKHSVGAPLGLFLVGLIMALDGWLLNQLLNHSIRAQQITFFSFLMGLVVLLSVPLLLVLAHQTIGCFTLHYHLDRNGITIRWWGLERVVLLLARVIRLLMLPYRIIGRSTLDSRPNRKGITARFGGFEQVIPIRDIQRIVPGQPLGDRIVQRRGLRWPGHERGEGQVPGIGQTRFLASRPLADQLLLVTPGLAFGISPRHPQGFVKAFEARQELGPNRLLELETHHARWLTWKIWADQTAQVLLGAAVAINLALFGYLCARFPNLDLQLPLHFNNQGLADRIGTKTELFALPIIALIILGTNLVLGLALYKREQAGSYLLWGAAAGAQALFWLATFNIVP